MTSRQRRRFSGTAVSSGEFHIISSTVPSIVGIVSIANSHSEEYEYKLDTAYTNTCTHTRLWSAFYVYICDECDLN